MKYGKELIKTKVYNKLVKGKGNFGCGLWVDRFGLPVASCGKKREKWIKRILA